MLGLRGLPAAPPAAAAPPKGRCSGSAAPPPAMITRVSLAVPAAVSLSFVLWSSPGTATLAVLLTATFALLVTPVRHSSSHARNCSCEQYLELRMSWVSHAALGWNIKHSQIRRCFQTNARHILTAVNAGILSGFSGLESTPGPDLPRLEVLEKWNG